MRVSIENMIFSQQDIEEIVEKLREYDVSVETHAFDTHSVKGVETAEVISWIITLSAAVLPTLIKILNDYYKERLKKGTACDYTIQIEDMTAMRKLTFRVSEEIHLSLPDGGDINVYISRGDEKKMKGGSRNGGENKGTNRDRSAASKQHRQNKR